LFLKYATLTLLTIVGIKNDFIQKVNDWKEYYDQADQEDSTFPNPWYDKLSDFQRILVVRTIRPDKVIPIIIKLIESELGENFIQPPPFDIQKSYNDSYCLNPLIFILSPGVDPMVSLLQFANKMDKTETIQSVSLGQGQVNYKNVIKLCIKKCKTNYRVL
jgi:dynein heavy chain